MEQLNAVNPLADKKIIITGMYVFNQLWYTFAESLFNL